MLTKRLCGLLAVGVLLLGTSAAVAGISSIIFRIDATSSSGSDIWTVPSSELVIEGQNYKWRLLSPHQLKYGPGPLDIIATLEDATLTLQDVNTLYPRVNMNFQLRAGAADVTIEIQSAIVTTFLPNAQATTSTAFSLTDAVNDGIPAQIAALPPNAGMYNAFYNGPTLFASLIPSFTIGGGSSGSTGTYFHPPGGGFTPIGGNITDMQVKYGFTLTATDLMTGTNTYFAFPEPASFALLALISLLRRR